MKLRIQFGWAALLALTMVAGAPSAKAQVSKDGSNVQIGQVKDDLFAGTHEFAKNAVSVTEINMGPQSLDEVEGDNAAKARRTVLSVVRTYTYDKPGMYNMADVQKYQEKLQTADWRCSVHTYDEKGNSTDVCRRHRSDGLRESAIITVAPKSLTFIHTIRRSGGPGESELGDLPMGFSMDGLPALAMIGPEMQQLQLGLRNVQMPDMAAIQASVDAALQNLPKLDSAGMQRRMDEAQKHLDEMNRRMKDWKLPSEHSQGSAKGPEE